MGMKSKGTKFREVVASAWPPIVQVMRKTRIFSTLESRLATRIDSKLEEKIENRLAPALGEAVAPFRRHGQDQILNLVNNAFNVASGETRNGVRSVLFLHQSYYHFYYLSRALRKRGWNALLLDMSSPGSVWSKYYHGSDVRFHSDDPEVQHLFESAAYDYAKYNFSMIHFAGDGLFSFFTENRGFDVGSDMLDLRASGIRLGYSIGGCNSGVSREDVARWSMLGGRNVCDTCVWNDRPDICSPVQSDQWGKAVQENCDLICAEMVPSLGRIQGSSVIFEPLSMCSDPSLWNPDIVVPPWIENLRRNPDEVLIFHGMGEVVTRSDDRRNIKGTPAIVAAVDRMQREGMNVRLVFKSGVSNRLMPYYQVQADIVVDQLNYGRYGAQAREGMMLGKPVVCYLNRHEMADNVRNHALAECPLVSAGEEEVYEVLRELVLDEAKRKVIGRDSYDYAMKWHHPDRCAERYEKVYDALQCGIPASAVVIA